MKLEHQVGGHPNVTSDESGTLVIKPASPREIAFYQLLHATPAPPKDLEMPFVNPGVQQDTGGTVLDSSGTSQIPKESAPSQVSDAKESSLIKRELLLGHLKKFLPQFYGTLKVESLPLTLPADPSSQVTDENDDERSIERPASLVNSVDSLTECIILLNLSAPFLRPCIMDIKLGTVLYDATDPALTEAKRQKMEEKMRVRSSTKTGMAITGFQTWNAQEQRFVSCDRESCRKLKPEELADAFTQFFSVPTTNSASQLNMNDSGTVDLHEDGLDGLQGDGDQTDPTGGQPASLGLTTAFSNSSSGTPGTDLHRLDMMRSLRALLATLESFYALISHLEIRFIGASLLIIYEGDAERLRQAWQLVDRGESRGDGLDDDFAVDDDDYSDIGEEEDHQVLLGNTMPAEGHAGHNTATHRNNKKSLFTQIFGGFGAERNDGSQGFALLDETPPASPRHSHTTLTDTLAAVQAGSYPSADPDAHDMNGDLSDEERFADEDAKDRVPRPFTLRLIDFAHTRLADGEGPDVGFLKGVRRLIDIVQGRIQELQGL